MTSSSPPPPDNWRPSHGLTAIESEMLVAAATGGLVDRAGGPFDLDAMKRWGQDRTIRALVLRYLLVVADWPVHAKGVHLCGVRISGQLDLEAATLRCPLRLERCYLPEPVPVNFNYASASLLTLTDCYLAGLRGNSLVVTKDLDLSGSEFKSELRLVGANIAGQFNCSRAKLTNYDDDTYSVMLSLPVDLEIDNALNADNIRIGGDVRLDRVFVTAGAVRLVDADIAGRLNCRGANLAGVDNHGDALVAENIRVGGDAFLDGKFTASGAIRLVQAQIAGQLTCSGAQLSAAPGRDGYALIAFRMNIGGDVFLDKDELVNEDFTAKGAVLLTGANIIGQLTCSGARLGGIDKWGNALVAAGMKTGHHVILDENFTAAGAVRLNGADITGELRFLDAHLSDAKGSDGYALIANGMSVSGDVLFDGCFSAEGTLSLRSARIDGSLTMRPRTLQGDALDLTGAHITHELCWEPQAPIAGRVTLKDAVVGELQDSWIERSNGFWPDAKDDKLQLDGFTYGRLHAVHAVTVRQRLAWLGSPKKRARKRAGRFATQPYEQLAKVYEQAGQDKEARQVAIARRRDLRRYGDLSRMGRFTNRLLDFSIQYGYQTSRAIGGIIILYLLVLGFLLVARDHNALIPVQTIVGLHPVPTATSCSGNYPCFNPFGYAIDTVIPIINVHQADFWGPNESNGWGTACAVVSYAGIGIGWALATLVVAGYTGLARKIDPS
jgi:hypothetical protein